MKEALGLMIPKVPSSSDILCVIRMLHSNLSITTAGVQKVHIIEESFPEEMWRLNSILSNGNNLNWQERLSQIGESV